MEVVNTIEQIADNGRSPYWLDLMTDGKTLVIIYPWCVEDGLTIEKIAMRFHELMGEPEFMGKVNPKKSYPAPYEKDSSFVMIFPNQNLPPELKDIGERMTSASLLKALGMGK